MKIAQIVCAFHPYKGGIGNIANKYSEILRQAGHNITTFTPDYKKIGNEKNITRLNPWLKYGNGAFLPQLFFILKKYDLIYLHYPFFGSAEIIWLIKLFNKNVKLIIHYHMDVKMSSFISTFLGLPSRLIRNSLFKKADFITCASLDYVKYSQIVNLYKKYKNKFIEIPFGVDINKFKPSPVNKTKTTFQILFVGGLDKAHYFKGINILLEVIAKIEIKNLTQNWELNIVGDGDLKSQYQNQAKKLNISNRINFLGKISDEKKIKIYQQADLFILPSINKNEAFGLVLLEAMASGIPVIASNLPGVRTVFQDEIQGYLVEPNNIINLKEKIEKILNDSELRNKMSQAARQLAKEKYNLENVKNKLTNLIKKL